MPLFEVFSHVKDQVLLDKATAIRRAAMRGGSDALRAAQAEAVRQVRARRNIRAKNIRDAISLRYPKSERETVLRWFLVVSKKPMPLIAYGARQTATGVSVQVKAQGRAVLRGAFIATMPAPSFHRGVFMRTGKFGRRGDPKLEKIKQRFSTTVLDVFTDQGFVDAVGERAKAVFRTTFARNLIELAGTRGGK